MIIGLYVFVGVLLGVIGSKYLFVGQWYSLIIWVIVGLIVGFLGVNKKEVGVQGGVYGFFLFFVFMVAGYNGTRPMSAVLPFFILIGILGIVFGEIFSFTGFFVKHFFNKKIRE